MITEAFQHEVIEQLEKLPMEKQQQVLDFAKALSTAQTQGIPGKELLKYIGTIDSDDLAEMSAAIEEGCEQVAQLKVIDLNGQELSALLHSGALAGHRLRLIVDPDEEDLTIGIPDHPFTVRSREQLVELLLRSVDDLDNGLGIEATPEYWAQKEQRVLNRLGPA